MLAFVLVSALLASGNAFAANPYYFDEKDRGFLASLSLNNLTTIKHHRYSSYLAKNEVAEFGKRLFFDARLSSSGTVACASCHIPEKYFTDSLPQAIGAGQMTRNTPSILVSKWSPWQTWDGAKDSMWSQALGPLESPTEHGIHRNDVIKLIRIHYGEIYTKIFGAINDSPEGINHAFANVGKALMAYQFKLTIQPSRFDQFIDAVVQKNPQQAKKLFSLAEVNGLRLFAGKGNCISCHNGPLLTNFEFHNVGIPQRDPSAVDLGRYQGVKQLAQDKFSCLSPYSGMEEKDCLEMKYLKKSGPELVGAFKTPSLRNVDKTAPYMHAGQFETLEDVVNHYDKPKPPFYDRKQHPNRPHFDILPLRLSDEEKNQLVAFLKTLTSPIPVNDPWWQQPFISH